MSIRPPAIIRLPEITLDHPREARLLAQMLRWSWPDAVRWVHLDQPSEPCARAIITIGESRYEVQVTRISGPSHGATIRD